MNKIDVKINAKNTIITLLIGCYLVLGLPAIIISQSVVQGDDTFEEEQEEFLFLRSVTGIVLIDEDAFDRTFLLDTDGDGDEDFHLEFGSEDIRFSMPSAGERVTVKGEIHGRTLEVHQILER